MRIQTIKLQPFYDPSAHLRTVTFNGKVVPRHLLIEANDETGMLVTLKAHDDGKIMHIDGDTITVIERGAVTISDPVVVPLPEEVPFR